MIVPGVDRLHTWRSRCGLLHEVFVNTETEDPQRMHPCLTNTVKPMEHPCPMLSSTLLNPLPAAAPHSLLLLLRVCAVACAPHHPTGIVVAVRGRAEPGGDFVVSDVMWPGLAPQPERPLMDQDKYVALVSGLQLADRKSDKMQVRGSTWGPGGVSRVALCCVVFFERGEGSNMRCNGSYIW